LLDFVPVLLMVAIGVDCLQRTTKQPTRVPQMFTFAVAGLCFVLGFVLLVPVVVPIAKPFYAGIHGGFWFILKVSLYIYFFMWLRFTIPRYRFDQLMRLGWNFLIPLSIINILLVGVALIVGAYFHLHGWGLLLVTTPAAILALVAAFLILAIEKQHYARQKWVALIVALALAGQVGVMFWTSGKMPGQGLPVLTAVAANRLPPNSETVAHSLFESYLLPFEIASVLLLVAMIGAVVMAKKRA